MEMLQEIKKSLLCNDGTELFAYTIHQIQLFFFFFFLVLLGWEFFHFSALFPQLVLCKIIFLIYKSE